jgi:probable O-glycosylation ligase (exosortase A-associated)
MRDLLVTLIVIGAIPYTLSRPHIGILVWSWIAYMVPHRLAWGWARQMPFAEVTAIATLIGMASSKEKLRFPVTPVTIAWITFVLYMTLTTVFAMYPEYAWPQWSKVIKIQVFAFITMMLINDRQRIQQFLWVLVPSIGFFGAKGGIYTLQRGSGLVWGPPGGFFADNNALALTLLIVMPLMYFLFRQSSNKWVKRALLATMVLSLFSVVGSFSRGAFVAGGCMALFFWWKSGKRAAFGLLGGTVIVAALLFAPQTWWDRMGTIENYEEDGSAMKRISAWTVAIGVASHRVFGGGFDCWSQENFDRYVDGKGARDVHSIYFEVLGEHGYGGLLIWLILGLLAWRTARWIIRNCKGRPGLNWHSDLAAMIQVALIAYASGGAFLGLAYFDLPYALLALLVVTRQLVERELAAEGSSRLGAAQGVTHRGARVLAQIPSRVG